MFYENVILLRRHQPTPLPPKYILHSYRPLFLKTQPNLSERDCRSSFPFYLLIDSMISCLVMMCTSPRRSFISTALFSRVINLETSSILVFMLTKGKGFC